MNGLLPSEPYPPIVLDRIERRTTDPAALTEIARLRAHLQPGPSLQADLDRIKAEADEFESVLRGHVRRFRKQRERWDRQAALLMFGVHL